jgi:hypothetical protein
MNRPKRARESLGQPGPHCAAGLMPTLYSFHWTATITVNLSHLGFITRGRPVGRLSIIRLLTPCSPRIRMSISPT